MNYMLVFLLLVSLSGYCQISINLAQDSSVRKYHMGQYSYHEQFIGHRSYGAPLILTGDGGAAAFGDGDEGTMLVKLDSTGKVQWKRTVKPKGEEMESQSVVQDKAGNYYVFMLVHGLSAEHRGGCERVVLINKVGTTVWDKFIGTCTQLNTPTVDYIKALSDGRIALRGHVVIKKPQEGKDPAYHYWEGWLTSKGVLTQKTGAAIDWNKPEWKKLFSPE